MARTPKAKHPAGPTEAQLEELEAARITAAKLAEAVAATRGALKTATAELRQVEAGGAPLMIAEDDDPLEFLEGQSLKVRREAVGSLEGKLQQYERLGRKANSQLRVAQTRVGDEKLRQLRPEVAEHAAELIGSLLLVSDAAIKLQDAVAKAEATAGHVNPAILPSSSLGDLRADRDRNMMVRLVHAICRAWDRPVPKSVTGLPEGVRIEDVIGSAARTT